MIKKRFPASRFIKEAMEIKGWTNEDLAKKTGISSKTISLLLSDKTPFTIKMDHLIGPELGFPIGTLSSLEALYLDWFYQQPDNWKNIDIYQFNFSFRKHKNTNEEKLKKTIILAERKIRTTKAETLKDMKTSLENYFFNEYLNSIAAIENISSFYKFINDLSNEGINLYLFEGVNIRGMSKKNEKGFFIFINKSLNKTIDSFIMTLTHEILHYIDFDIDNLQMQKIENIDDEEQEKKLDALAIDFMLLKKKDVIEEIIEDNDLQHSNINVLKDFSQYLNVNWIYLYGLITYISNDYRKKYELEDIKIKYDEERIWEHKNI